MKMKSWVTMSILSAALQFTPIALAEDAKGHDKGWRHHEERWANLPADEQAKLKAAHEKAMQDPGVQTAHTKMRQAHREFRDAMHAAMLKADPSIQPILAKLPKGEKDDE